MKIAFAIGGPGDSGKRPIIFVGGKRPLIKGDKDTRVDIDGDL